jgi:hypothetical protein
VAVRATGDEFVIVCDESGCDAVCGPGGGVRFDVESSTPPDSEIAACLADAGWSRGAAGSGHLCPDHGVGA